MEPLKEIQLPVFEPRWYQIPPMRALDSGVRNVLLCWARRNGKDVFALNYMAKRAFLEKGVYFYILPTYSQGKKVIWDSITNDGIKMLDYIPQEIRLSENSQEMKIVLSNGSVFQIIGSKNFDMLMGTNPRGIVFSEYAISDPLAFEYIQPILAANPESWQIIVSTPRGRNSFYDLYMHAKNSSDWYCDLKTSFDTNVISEYFLKKERLRGVSEDHIQQEYFCSFSRGIEGSYYGKLMQEAALDDRIGNVCYEPTSRVNIAFDLGMADDTVIWFWQQIGREIHLIDYYENYGEPLAHYAKMIKNKDYVYGDVWLPHDAKVRELGTGISRIEVLKNLGISGRVVPSLSVMDGIEAVRGILPRCWFDTKKCEQGIRHLEMYHRQYSHKNQVYSDHPCHDGHSHACDSFRMLAIASSKAAMAEGGLSSEEWAAVRRRNI